MAFPVYQSNTDTDFDTSVTSMPVNMPATVNSGDLLLAIEAQRNNATFTAPLATPTGWVALSSQQGGGSAGYMRTWYKIADGTEDGGTATWTASIATTAAWSVIRITSWHGTTPPEAATANGDATNANPPSLNPTGWDTEDTLWLALAGNVATGEITGFTAAPTNYINLHSNGASTGGSTCNIASSTRELAAASEDPGTFTPNSNRFWTAATVAVRPAAGGGGGGENRLQGMINGGGLIPTYRSY